MQKFESFEKVKQILIDGDKEFAALLPGYEKWFEDVIQPDIDTHADTKKMEEMIQGMTLMAFNAGYMNIRIVLANMLDSVSKFKKDQPK